MWRTFKISSGTLIICNQKSLTSIQDFKAVYRLFLHLENFYDIIKNFSLVHFIQYFFLTSLIAIYFLKYLERSFCWGICSWNWRNFSKVHESSSNLPLEYGRPDFGWVFWEYAKWWFWNLSIRLPKFAAFKTVRKMRKTFLIIMEWFTRWRFSTFGTLELFLYRILS